MNPLRHPYYQSPREEQREAFIEDIENFVASLRKTPRRGVRVLPDGTIDCYQLAA